MLGIWKARDEWAEALKITDPFDMGMAVLAWAEFHGFDPMRDDRFASQSSARKLAWLRVARRLKQQTLRWADDGGRQ